MPADEVVLKKRRESDAASVRSALSEVKSEKEKKKDKKSKKAKKDEEPEPEPELQNELESEGVLLSDSPEKPKKKKKSKNTQNEDVVMDDAEEEVETKASKKDKKEKKRKRAAEEEDEKPTPKSEKKSKKSKKSKSEDTAEEADTQTNADAENWHVDELEGGQSRQAKFMRLLGGNKGGAVAATDSPSAKKVKKGKSDATKAEADIQRQFETGMKAKNEGGSHRRGLGA